MMYDSSSGEGFESSSLPYSAAGASYHRSMTCGSLTGENQVKLMFSPNQSAKEIMDGSGFVKIAFLDGDLQISDQKVRDFAFGEDPAKATVANLNMKRLKSAEEKNRLSLLIHSYLTRIPFASVKHDPMHQYWTAIVHQPNVFLEFRVFLFQQPADREAEQQQHSIDMVYVQGDQMAFYSLLDGLLFVLGQKTKDTLNTGYSTVQDDADDFGFLSADGMAGYWRASVDVLKTMHTPTANGIETFEALKVIFDAAHQASAHVQLIEMDAVDALLNVFAPRPAIASPCSTQEVPVEEPENTFPFAKPVADYHHMLKPYAVQALAALAGVPNVLTHLAAHAGLLAFISNVTAADNNTPLVAIVEKCKELQAAITQMVRLSPCGVSEETRRWVEGIDMRMKDVSPKSDGLLRLTGMKRPLC